MKCNAVYHVYTKKERHGGSKHLQDGDLVRPWVVVREDDAVVSADAERDEYNGQDDEEGPDAIDGAVDDLHDSHVVGCAEDRNGQHGRTQNGSFGLWHVDDVKVLSEIPKIGLNFIIVSRKA